MIGFIILGVVALIIAFGVYSFSPKSTLSGFRLPTYQSPNTGKPNPKSTRLQSKEEPLPDPTPLWDFDLETAKVRDYIYVNKTLRHPYFQTMAHQPMDINNWIEIDRDYKRDMASKKHCVQTMGTKVINSLPENHLACHELLNTLIDYLPKKYPTCFERIEGGIWNKILDERHENVAHLEGIPALEIIASLVQDDFLMGHERPDGHIYFTGGVVAHPGFYNFSEKINNSLSVVHEPVPHFNEKILKSVERTLSRFQPNEPFERTSWEMVDDYNLNLHEIATLPEGAVLRDSLKPKDYLFRMDHQTFRKMPLSNGIIFGVHPILVKLEEFADKPMVPALLATIHEKSGDELMKYKLAQCYQDKMLPYLKELTKSQIERGLITGDEAVAGFRELIK